MELPNLAKGCHILRLAPPPNEALPEYLTALLHAGRDWRLVSSALGEEAAAATGSEHESWARQHGHAHPYRELLVPLAGRCPFGWRGRILVCQPGTLFLCEGGETHDLQYPPTTQPFLHLWLTVSPGDCLGSIIWMGDRMVPLWRVHVATGEDRLVPCVSRVWDRAREERDPVIGRQRVLAALYLLLADIADQARDPDQAAGSTREECVRIARRMLDQAHGCGLDLAALARATGYSKFHFHRLFRELTGQTVHDYADARRRAWAAELLAAKLPHKEVTFELGFSSPSAFSRWFHQAAKNATR